MSTTYWGCKTCKRKFVKGKAPKHERTFLDMMSDKVFVQSCAGVGVATVKIDSETRRRIK
jgi:hypothetical protein